MIHILGMPHTAMDETSSHCAYSSRTATFAAMMPGTILYASTPEERVRWWPDYDGTQVFNDFDPNSLGWREFNARSAAEIREAYQPGDILAITMGLAQKPVADALADTGITVAETGIGYSGVFAPFRVFESHPWRAFLSTREPTDTVRLYDEVIPRAWEIEDFPAGDGGGDYFLFIGRLMARKGPHIAALTAQRIGAKLLVAGQGAAKVEPGRITCDDGTLIEGDVEYVGVVGPDERARLMGHASAVFAPTLYFEPLGGVVCEANLVGTPAITTNYGAFTSTVEQGVTGYRANTLAEFAEAATMASRLPREAIRANAIARYSTEAVRPQFERYFERLATLRDGGLGWYS